jgi:hypothetical protein
MAIAWATAWSQVDCWSAVAPVQPVKMLPSTPSNNRLVAAILIWCLQSSPIRSDGSRGQVRAKKSACLRRQPPFFDSGGRHLVFPAGNAGLHAERADWTWDRVLADADATAELLIAELSAADDETLVDSKVVASILGDGAEHDLGHLPQIAADAGIDGRVLGLADSHLATIDRGGWPSRAAAVARYNLACFHALAGNLDVARSLLRQALPGHDDLQTLAPTDDDLIAVRYELSVLREG